MVNLGCPTILYIEFHGICRYEAEEEAIQDAMVRYFAGHRIQQTFELTTLFMT